jgi:hypothetical protein
MIYKHVTIDWRRVICEFVIVEKMIVKEFARAHHKQCTQQASYFRAAPLPPLCAAYSPQSKQRRGTMLTRCVAGTWRSSWEEPQPTHRVRTAVMTAGHAPALSGRNNAMATQFVSPSTSSPRTHHTRTRSQAAQLRRAEALFQIIGACTDACTVAQLRELRDYLNQFLALPPEVLSAWEEL